MPSQTIKLPADCTFSCPEDWTLTKSILDKLNRLCIESEKQQRKSKDSHSGHSMEHDEAVHKFMSELIKDGKIDENLLKVKSMRGWIPQLVMMLYDIRHDDTQRKVKNMWTNRPDDWPVGLPFRDPNNKPKDGQKPNKEELEDVFRHLARRYIKEKYHAGSHPIQESENRDDDESGDEAEPENQPKEEHESDRFWKQQENMIGCETKPMMEEEAMTTDLVTDISRLGVSSPERDEILPGPETQKPTYVPDVTQASVDGNPSLYDLDNNNIINTQVPAPASMPIMYNTAETPVFSNANIPMVQFPMTYSAVNSSFLTAVNTNPLNLIYQTSVYMPAQASWLPVAIPPVPEIPPQPMQNGLLTSEARNVQFSQEETPKQESLVTNIEPKPQQSVSESMYQLSEQENLQVPLAKPELLTPVNGSNPNAWPQRASGIPTAREEQRPDSTAEDDMLALGDCKPVAKAPPPQPNLTTGCVVGMEEDCVKSASDYGQVPDVAAHLEVNTHKHDDVPPDPRSDVAAYEDIEEQKEEEMMESSETKVPIPMDITSEKVIETKSVITDVVPLPSEQQESSTGFHAIPATVSDFEPKRKTPPVKKHYPLHPKKRRLNMATQTQR